jgi:hypothetical protein
VTGNAVSSNALTVRQFGTGNVFSAQTTTGSTALFVGANGNVGVGTTGPQTALQVSGPANTATNRATPYANAFASVTNDIFYGTTSQVGLEIGSGTRASGDNDRVYKYVLNTINNATVGAGVDFQILGIPTAAGSYTSDGTARNRVTIRYDGNVGIGIANPTTILQLSSADGVDPLIVTGRTNARANGSEYTVAGLDSYFVTRDGVVNLGGYIRINDVNTNGSFPTTVRGGRIVFGTVDGISGTSSQASERMTILANGRIGIGTTDPKGTFNVLSGNAGYPDASGTGSSNVVARIQSGSICLDFGSIGGTNPFWIQNHLSTNNATNYPILLNPNGGSVGIGTTNPSSYTLQVSGTIGATGDITAFFSDDRLKTKTGRIESALEKVLSLEAFTYVPNDLAKSFGFEDSKQRVGLSAQSVQRILPEAVCPAPFDADNASGQGYLTVQYDKLVPLLVEAIKELAGKK